ncbi:hypothetical protein [Chromobacterium alticapitis]|uniref:Uncharacterized protein n=1 Tax=Chromobacterium alticapitis TaxID=2073169 RepID=A0A2S5DFY1_9NEIS|nr:hypothetical protein [Chromobacterium alticapitis]POZ61921.1 hypothetical protein C2I19_11045 [Chromobacterium alticapitis]
MTQFFFTYRKMIGRLKFFIVVGLVAILFPIFSVAGSGQLMYMVHDLSDRVIFPILIDGGVCKNNKDCKEKDIVLATNSDDEVFIYVYGVSNTELILKIVSKLKKESNRVKTITFFKEAHGESFLDLFHTVIAKYNLK